MREAAMDYALCCTRISQISSFQELGASLACLRPILQLPPKRLVSRATETGKQTKPQPPEKQIQNFAQEIACGIPDGAPEAYIDLWTHDHSIPGRSLFQIFQAQLRLYERELVPLVPLRVPGAEAEVLRAAAARRGLAIKLSYRDLSSTTIQDIRRQLRSLELTPEKCSLVLDLGRIPDGSSQRDEFELRVIASLLKLRTPEFREVVILAGSCPASNSGLNFDDLSIAERRERGFFDRVVEASRGLCRIVPGDYGPVAPDGSGSFGGGAPQTPSIRYTTSNHWLISRGHRAAKGTSPQPSDYVPIAERLTLNPRFRSALSRGDHYIEELAGSRVMDANPAIVLRESTVSHAVFSIAENRQRVASWD